MGNAFHLNQITHTMNLLLLSNSTNPGQPYLEWPMDYIDRFLGTFKEALFIPYAAVSFSYDDYESKVQEALIKRDIKIKSIHHFDDPIEAINNAQAIIVGGGNSFHLLDQVQRLGLVGPLQRRVKEEEIHYIGWSAGSNLACPTVKTTNDMPIIEPQSFNALHFIDFQINPHYTERTIEGHGGESRLMRLEEYVSINDIPVLCLPESCGIRIDESGSRLLSSEPVKLLSPAGNVKTLHPGIVDL